MTNLLIFDKVKNMPVRNVVKDYLPNQIYHVYNRGVEKRQIFMDDLDYRTFLFSLKLYLSPPPIQEVNKGNDEGFTLLRVKPLIDPNLSLHKEVDLLSFNLQPNHFHLQIKQKTLDGMAKLLQRVCSRYSTYFNQRHRRRGGLFEGTYKAIRLNSPLDILYISYYINLNNWLERDDDGRLHLKQGYTLNRVTPSTLENTYVSLPYYLSNAQADWIKPQEVLDVLQKLPQRYGSYQNFLKAKLKDFDEVLAGKILED